MMKYGILSIIATALIFLTGTTKPTEVEIVNVRDTITMIQPNEAMYTLPQARPLPGYKTGSPYGYRIHPIHKVKKMHTGIDIGCPIGTPLYAQGNGKVIRVEYKRSGYGINIVITHGMNSDGKEIRVLYGHLSKPLVKAGDFVTLGEIIALTGNTGTSTAPHLHYEYIINKEKVNPEKQLCFEERCNQVLTNTDSRKSMYGEIRKFSIDEAITYSSAMRKYGS